MAGLVYVMGASGAGKDSVLGYARQRCADLGVAFAHRYITRPAESGGENHVALTPEEFDRRARLGLFALHWTANGHCYGIGREIELWRAAGLTVIMNGSRGYLDEARRRYPDLTAVLVRADEGALRQRLANRGRETLEELEARLARNRELEARLGAGVGAGRNADLICIDNDGRLETAGQSLLALLRTMVLPPRITVRSAEQPGGSACP